MWLTGQLSYRTCQLHLLCVCRSRGTKECHDLKHGYGDCSYTIEHEEEWNGAYEEGLRELASDVCVGNGEDDDVGECD